MDSPQSTQRSQRRRVKEQNKEINRREHGERGEKIKSKPQSTRQWRRAKAGEDRPIARTLLEITEKSNQSDKKTTKGTGGEFHRSRRRKQ